MKIGKAPHSVRDALSQEVMGVVKQPCHEEKRPPVTNTVVPLM